MQKRLPKRQPRAYKSLFAQFFIFYLLILLVPIIISGAMYMRSLEIISQEIDNANQSVLKKIQISIDSRLGDIENTASSLGFDTNVTGLLFDRDITPNDRLVMNKIIRSLYNVTASNQFIKEICLYFRNSDTILTTTCSLSGENYFSAASDPLFHNVDWSGTQARLAESAAVLPASWFIDSPSLIYFRSLPLAEITGSQALLAIYINPVEIKTILTSDDNMGTGFFVIVDSTGRVYAPGAPPSLDTASLQGRLENNESIQYMELNGEDVVISQNLSSRFGLKFLSVTPKAAYEQRLNSIRGLYMLSLVLCCLLGGFLAVYFAKRNYNPIKEIVANITGNPASVQKGFNEYDILRESIRKIISDNADTQSLVKTQKATLKSTFLTSLVKGSKHDCEYTVEGLKFFDINFAWTNFAVLVLSIDRFAPSDLVQEKETISSQAEKYFGQLGQCILVDTDDGAIILLNLPPEIAGEQLKRIAFQLIDALKNDVSIIITIAISSVIPKFSQIGAAYREAEHALEYRMLAGSGSVLNFPEIQAYGAQKTAGHQTIYDRQQLAVSLRSGDINAARFILRHIIDEEFYSRYLTIPIAKCKMSALIDTMMTAIQEMPAGDSAYASINKSGCIESLLACKTITELRMTMEEILDQIETDILQMKNEKSDQMKSEVLSYIAGHFRELDFNVSTVAYHFGMSIDGISRFFKKKMNTGLLTYINDFRIEQAVKMMEDGDPAIKLVAEAVGFSNSDAFIRVFKKVKGTTPGKYKEMMADQKKA